MKNYVPTFNEFVVEQQLSVKKNNKGIDLPKTNLIKIAII